nr:MAG TPA: hypothetical protein [Caudoviricetes sp.]DAS57016.1 MAG TPA: hypothetical protein [Caudoviricetes sp.]
MSCLTGTPEIFEAEKKTMKKLCYSLFLWQ